VPVLVSLKDVTHRFQAGTGGEVLALSGIDLEIGDNEFVSLIGPSGCGKSTALNIIAGLLEPTEGEVAIAGQPPVRARDAREIGVVFQDAVLLPWRDARENTGFLLEVIGKLDADGRRRVDDLLELVGLQDFADRYPHQLSGGMRQRVSIARALTLDPLLLLMDEPFGALDEFTRYRLNVELLRIWSKTRKTVLFVTHNIGEAVFMSDRVIAMGSRPGRIIEDLSIDLDRPRTRDVRYSKEFTDYVVHLQRLLEEPDDGDPDSAGH